MNQALCAGTQVNCEISSMDALACPMGTEQGKPATCKQGATMPQAARVETSKSRSPNLRTQAAGGCLLERGTAHEALRGPVPRMRAPGEHLKGMMVRSKVGSDSTLNRRTTEIIEITKIRDLRLPAKTPCLLGGIPSRKGVAYYGRQAKLLRRASKPTTEGK
jgi:hypothetical protein